MVNSLCPQFLVRKFPIFKNISLLIFLHQNITFLFFSILLGQAGVDFPVLAQIPDTGFDCGIQEFPGIYGDTGADCQVNKIRPIHIFSTFLGLVHPFTFIVFGN